MFVKNDLIYEKLNANLVDLVKRYQMEETIKSLEFIDENNIRQIESFARHLKIEFFLPGDIIMKEGDIPSKFYFVHKGVAEALIELEDFDYFNY